MVADICYQNDGCAHPSAVETVGSSDSVAVMVFERHWMLSFVIFSLVFVPFGQSISGPFLHMYYSVCELFRQHYSAFFSFF
jgi:hypothetical protein